MSHIIANPSVETDMTNNFVCKLYWEDHYSMEVRNNGMDPYGRVCMEDAKIC